MQLPAALEIRYCAQDNFLFQANGSQSDYDAYYAAVANDCGHKYVYTEGRSPIAILQKDMLLGALGDFFSSSKKVMDFGCGEAALLTELAHHFPASDFFGFDPGPRAPIGASRAKALGLNNVSIMDQKKIAGHGPYDLIILSHVVEHFLDFEALRPCNEMLKEGGMMYIEVPDALAYEEYERHQFLYYFDRLHVNHFTPESMTRVMAKFGLTYVSHFSYPLPYKDSGGYYPVLGVVLRKAKESLAIKSPDIWDKASHYIEQEKIKAQKIAAQLDEFEGVLIWGGGDNFYRSTENGGPLSRLRTMVVLDSRPHELTVGNHTYQTMLPPEGIRQYPWPVVIAVTEGGKMIAQQVAQMDPGRRIFYI